MATVNTFGAMAKAMKASIWTTRNMVTGYTVGQMDVSTKATGRVANRMGWVNIM